MKKIVVLTGAGISAESGIQTFRSDDGEGLWDGYDIMDVASISGWLADPQLVLDFYNERRAQLFEVEPNMAHTYLADLESFYEVQIITQNVDDLHERAGSTEVLHLHGELRKVRSNETDYMIYDWEDDLHLGDLAEDDTQLRPAIVWFGEDVPLINTAIEVVESADILLVIGTSLQVYPAADLINYAPQTAEIYYIDPQASDKNLPEYINCIDETATVGMKELFFKLVDNQY